jgi:hypothetical protein
MTSDLARPYFSVSDFALRVAVWAFFRVNCFL